MRASSSVVFCALLAMSCADSGDESNVESDSRERDLVWTPLPPDASYEGKTLAEWAVAWSQWMYSPTDCDSAAFDPDGSDCGLYQEPESPVFFLALSASARRRTECAIPEGKAVFVPMISINSDNAGVEPPLSEDELMAIVDDGFETMRDVYLRADEAVISDLDDHAITRTPYSYDLPPPPNWYSCNGTEGVGEMTVPAYIAGYFALFPPPEPGEHRLEYGGVLSYEGEAYALRADTNFVVVEP